MITRNLRKERIGLVSSNAMDKSIVVSVERRVKHARYGKFNLSSVRPGTFFFISKYSKK